MSAPRLRISPPGPRRAAETRWDAESSTFSCNVRSVEGDTSSPTLRDRVDAALHIEEPTRRVVIGDLDVIVDEAGRPASLELYTNPRRWKRAESPPPDAEPADVALELEVDANGIASADAPLTVEHDPSRGALTLRFGPEVERWYAAAEGLLVGADGEGLLAAIRCAPVVVR